MNKLNLILHCGGRTAPLDVVSNVPTPNPEGRWVPVAHIDVHTSVERSVSALGLEIVGQVHALSQDLNRYFAMYQLASSNPDMGMVLATRNSHDRTFIAGLCVGEGVFVCDNLSFHGEVTLGRRHTTHIRRDLPGLCDRAVAELVSGWTRASDRVAAYRGHQLTSEAVNDLLVRSMDCGVITAASIPRVLAEYRHPRHEEFTEGGNTAWRLFNAYTEDFKSLGNPVTLAKRSQILHGLMSLECGIQSPASRN